MIIIKRVFHNKTDKKIKHNTQFEILKVKLQHIKNILSTKQIKIQTANTLYGLVNKQPMPVYIVEVNLKKDFKLLLDCFK